MEACTYTTDAVQIGMHGAGLVNAFFMRPGAALVEIFPCRFGDDHQRNYFWHPSHAEMETFAFQIYVTNESSCVASDLQNNPEGKLSIISKFSHSACEAEK